MILINCRHCGREISTTPAVLKRKKFCSRSCLGKSKTGKNAANYKDGRSMLPRTCASCGAEFVGAARNKYCSLACFRSVRPPTFKICLRCGMRFGPVDHLDRKYCSQACANEAKTTGRKIRHKPTAKARYAQSLIGFHISTGRMERPLACEQCGAANVRIEAAHHDYDQPLNVRWLCTSCHRRWDKLNPKGGTYRVYTQSVAG